MLPFLKEVQSASKKYGVVFRGLNYGEGTQDGEFADTHNLSTDKYPCITQRAARIQQGEYAEATTIHGKGELLVIAGTKVYYGGKEVGTVTEGKKQTATVGNYIVIFPDKVYYKVPTEDDQDGEFGSMEASHKESWLSFTASTITLSTTGFDYCVAKDDVITISKCTKTENNKEVIVKEVTSDVLTFEDDTFVDAIEGGVTITRKDRKDTYSDCKIEFFPYAPATITKEGANFSCKVGDKVQILERMANGTEGAIVQLNYVTVESVTPDKITLGYYHDSGFYNSQVCNIAIHRVERECNLTALTFKNNTITKNHHRFKKGDAVTITGCTENGNNKETEIIIKDATPDVLTFDANTFTECVEEGEVTISRKLPDLDFICESNYRLWGTHGNTIYSSKYSDPFNFKVFEGLSSDSYYIDVSSEGDFTGCIPFSNYVLFFKENTLHKLYGTKPSNFQITTANVYGVQSGSERSLQIVNEQLLYKGVGGVYSYTGGVPELISEKFANRRYMDAVACCDGEKYYISMKQGEEWHLFTYDVLKNIWLREDNTQAVDMVFHDGKVHYIDSGGTLYVIDKTAERKDIEWGATFCTLHETINERKGYSKFHLRMDLSAGAWIAVDIKTDNDTRWQQVYTTHNTKAKTVSIPIIPTRCDSIDIRIRGKGECTIKAFVREFTTGSDV